MAFKRLNVYLLKYMDYSEREEIAWKGFLSAVEKRDLKACIKFTFFIKWLRSKQNIKY